MNQGKLIATVETARGRPIELRDMGDDGECELHAMTGLYAAGHLARNIRRPAGVDACEKCRERVLVCLEDRKAARNEIPK